MSSGFAKPRERLTDEKIQTLSAAELKAEAHQRGWPFGDMGARSARVLFWQLQHQYMGPIPEESTMQNANTPEERHKAHMAEKNAGKGADLDLGAPVNAETEAALTALRGTKPKAGDVFGRTA